MRARQVIIFCMLLFGHCRETPTHSDTAGNSHNPEYRALRRGVHFLLSLQRPDGAFVSGASPTDSPVGQTGYAVAALLRASKDWPELKNAVERARAFLQKSVETNGVWKYQPFLPPDLDDTTAAFAVLSISEPVQRDLRLKTMHSVLAYQNRDGGLRTWLTDDAGLSALGFKPKNFPITEVHAEVMAYFFATLEEHERAAVSEALKKAAQYLVKQQQADGRWKTVWYRSDFYATYRVHSLLAQLSDAEYAHAVRKAESYTIKRQRRDGSWGEQMPSILDTAFALLLLKNAKSADTAVMKKARDFLYAAQLKSGAWPAESFFFLDISQRKTGQAPTYIGNELYSTALILLALLN